MQELVLPHGGSLINRQTKQEDVAKLTKQAQSYPVIEVSNVTISDLEMIGIGAFSPLTGFIGKADYESVLETMHLASGEVWTIPITLPVTSETAKTLNVGQTIALAGNDGIIYGTIDIEEMYPVSPVREAELVYGTTDPAHPGVFRLYEQGSVYLAGPIQLLQRRHMAEFDQFYRDPEEVRKEFQKCNWRTVVGFQTRNPVHRAHEYIQKSALEIVDGLLLHPLVGETKADDIPADIRMRSYQVLLEHYYPQDRVFLSVNPAAMRYAGPREAVFHAIIRKNYGCTHFVVGRDHAGVGNFYGTYDSQKIFGQFSSSELGIQPLFFENSFYCDKCDGMASEKTCPHANEFRHILSGTKVRAALRSKEHLSPKLTRPEVARVLAEAELWRTE